MINKQPVRNFLKRILGYIETDTTTGNKTARNFGNKILGYYDAKRDITTNFLHSIVGYGDLTASLIFLEASKNG